VHGVAAKVAEEVGVLFKDKRIDPCASEQVAEHHAGGAAADDAAARRYRAFFPRITCVH
jgi:hypothetical protein